MKPPEEEFCRAKFTVYLERVDSNAILLWQEVPLKDEPPDYYLIINDEKYAVEVTVLMEQAKIGSQTLSNAAIVASLWSLADEVEKIAMQGDYLRGAYLVEFIQPIENLRKSRKNIQDSLLDYIRETQLIDQAPETIVFEMGGQTCSIRKLHNKKNVVYKSGPTSTKWEGEATSEICDILNERITAKKIKLEKVRENKILLLYEGYHFASQEMYNGCTTAIPNLSAFHTIFIVRGEDIENFVLISKQKGWIL